MQTWGRFSLIQDPEQADLVAIAMESLWVTLAAPEERWAQLRVFKGPTTPAFLAEVHKKLGGQLNVYTGPVPMEDQAELLWEGWISSRHPGVKNPKAHRRPSRSELLAITLLGTARDKLHEEDIRERAKQYPYDVQVAAEAGKIIRDTVADLKDLTGQPAKQRHRLVADDFCRQVTEVEQSGLKTMPDQTQLPVSAEPAVLGQAREAPLQSHLVTEPARENHPTSPLLWLEVATMVAAGRPAQDLTTQVKERGIAFDADREALWSLEALGAPDTLLQAVRAARLEKYYEAETKKLAEIKPEVVPVLRAALNRQPRNPVLHFAMARSLYERESRDMAIAEYREAVRLKPDFETAHLNLGVVLGKNGDLTGAIKEFREVIRLNPGNAMAHDNLGVALGMKGDLEGSISEHRAAVRLRPDYAIAHYNLGLALARKGKGDLVAARSELEEAVRLNANSAVTHNNLGNVLRYQGDLHGAAAEYREALRLQPNMPEANNNLSGVTRLMERPGAVEKESRKAVRKNPADPFAHNALGEALLGKGDLKGAIGEFRESILLKSEYPDAHANLGAALTREGKLEEGVAELREALRLKPGSANTHFLLGQALERKGDKSGALEAFRQAYTLAPQNPAYKARHDKLSRQD